MPRANRRLTRDSRYGRYTGGPDPLAPPADLTEALDAIGQDVMAGYSPERALREFLRRGGADQPGLDDLARRVAERRRELTQKNNLDGTLREVRELLDQAVLAERKQLARDALLDDGDRALAEMQLDSLSPSPAAAVSELSDYSWQSAEARQSYEKIKELLGREMLDQRFAGMKQALENATDADREAITAMLGDLNDLLDAHREGDDTPEKFDDFMAKHGAFFPEGPQNVDELIDALAARAAAAQRMRNSMTQEQRDELDALAQQAFGSPELMQALAQLDGNLQSLRPGEDWGGSERMDGDRASGSATAPASSRTSPTSTPWPTSSPSRRTARSSTTSTSTRSPGSSATQAAVDARDPAAAREGAARLGRDPSAAADGSFELTPKAMRAARQGPAPRRRGGMSGRQGKRDLRRAGAAGDRSGATRASGRSATPSRGTSPARSRTRSPARPVRRRPVPARDVPDRDRRRRGAGDRGPHAGLRRPARRHVVLDGDGGPLGADEAHRPRAAHPHHEPVPRRRPAADRLRSPGRGDGHRAARRPRRDVGQGHEPAPRAAAREPALPQAPECPAGAADRHRRRADVAPRAGRRGLLRLPARPAHHRLRRARARQLDATRRPHDVLPARRRPRARPLHRRRWPSGSAAPSWRRRPTTSAPRWSARTSARGGAAGRRLRRRFGGGSAGGLDYRRWAVCACGAEPLGRHRPAPSPPGCGDTPRATSAALAGGVCTNGARANRTSPSRPNAAADDAAPTCRHSRRGSGGQRAAAGTAESRRGPARDRRRAEEERPRHRGHVPARRREPTAREQPVAARGERVELSLGEELGEASPSVAAERRRGRRVDASSSSSLQLVADPAPEHGAELVLDVEGEAVVDAVAVAVRHREHVAALAVGVVRRRRRRRPCAAAPRSPRG